MKLKEAKEKARIESLNGYVQHVNIAGKWVNKSEGKTELDYKVSDWFCDSTVASYENGKEL